MDSARQTCLLRERGALHHIARGAPPGCGASGFSLHDLLSDRVVHAQIRDQLLQPGVLLFEFLQALGLTRGHVAVLGSPATVRLLPDA